ncbi:mechanosensitive ion channel [Sphingopyxis sp. XHP0097]|uniref:Mechanosensitive ion channel n=1 Tax=Sphingopyxis jiangsuensis TaxID=2871171 RepID=A0ABS7M952_9SPHN|nr:mechanosensitive ion channel domain-containing protein [Sphingopyxis jiangsuensis]MBY4635549.1 mechanosensitive ion channel [Sphingopyxis jiangsuensis]
MDELITRMGFPSIAEAQFAELGIAAAIAGAALLAGWIARRRLGPRLADWMHGRDIQARGPLTEATPTLLGWLVALLIVAIGWAAWPWDPYARLLLGAVAAIAAAAAVRNIVRGVGLGAGPALAAAAVAFVALLSNAVGGLTLLQERLDAVGFTVGRMNLSLLTLINIALTILALFLLVRIGNRIVRRVVRGGGGRDLDATQQLLVEKIAGVAIVIAAFFVGIDLLGIDLTAFAVFSGALGLAVGFGLQKTFGNLIAGIILLMDRSIKPGDVVVVADAVGRVNKIGVRAVSVITRDGKEHLVPNELLMTERVENWSYSNREVRVRLAVGVSYDADIRLAQKLMLDAADEAPRVLKSPAPVCWITGFGDSSVDHELRFWISDPEGGLGNIQGDVYLRIWDKFKEAGVEIPYPQRDLHVRTLPKEMPAPAQPKRASKKAD